MSGSATSVATAAPSPGTRRARRPSLAVGLAVGVVAAPLVLVSGGLTASGYLLPIRNAFAPSDAIVVLGGFGVPRAERAARLFADKVAPRVIVTGAGDCVAMWLTLVANGVPPVAIETDCAARSTFENAAATEAMLRRRRLTSATLVTHWFHARRAIATFRAAAPDVRFASVAVEPTATPRWRLGWTTEPKAVLSEYLKIAWYAVAHGVFVRISPEPDPGAGS